MRGRPKVIVIDDREYGNSNSDNKVIDDRWKLTIDKRKTWSYSVGGMIVNSEYEIRWNSYSCSRRLRVRVRSKTK